MRASRYFMATLREIPKEAEISSHRLMLRSGMIQQIASGLYAWLPLGLRVLQKIEDVIRQEHHKAGILEALVPFLQPAWLWQESGRYEDYGQEMLRLKDRHDRDMLYGPTAEEVFTFLFRTHIHSYKHLPQRLYNIQWKFRDEIRPRFGVMRAREFLMKDAYSFDLTVEGARESYQLFFNIYLKIFKRLGLQAIPVRASTGPIGGDLSHEFHILAHTGESTLYYDQALESSPRQSMADFHGIYAMADDEHRPQDCSVPPGQLKTSKGIEVGHIFYFGTKYSQPLNAYVTNRLGQRVAVEMGSYGIGVSRLVGAIIEAFHDEKGIRWPLSIAPYIAAIASMGRGDNGHVAEKLYQTLQDHQKEVFYYDLAKSPGEIFADLDLMGFPYQLIIGDQWAQSQCIEVKERATGQKFSFSIDELVNWLAKQHQEASRDFPNPSLIP